MKEPRNKSAKYLYRIGSWAIISLLLGPPLLIVVVLHFAKLNTLEQGIDSLNEWFGLHLAVYILILVTIWIWWSNRLAEWARFHVDPTEREFLEDKLASDDSFLLKRWSELDFFRRLQRGFGVILLFAMPFAAYWWYMDSKGWKEGPVVSTMASITKVYKKVKRKKVHYQIDYVFQDTSSMEVHGSRSLGTGYVGGHREENGFELSEGDAFELIYDPSDVSNQSTDLFQPDSLTLVKYFNMVRAVHCDTLAAAVCSCLLEGVYAQWGVLGLGIMNNREVDMLSNSNFNYMKYQTLIADEKFVKLEKACAELDLNTP